MTNLVMSLAGIAARLLPLSVKKGIYRIPWLSGVVRSSLNLAVPPGLTSVKIAAGGLAGMQIPLDLKTEKDYWLGTYEPELQSGILALVKPGMIAYDVGANIGYISLLLAKAVGESGSVYAFEALPENLARLRVNLALNAKQDVVKVVAGAVVDRTEPVHFRVGPSTGMGKAEGSAGRLDIHYADSILVDGFALDDYIYRANNPEPEVIKIDIEGGEALALPGMRRVLVKARPLVFLELHGPDAASVAWQELHSAGYRVCYLSPEYPEVVSSEDLDWKAYLVAFPAY